MGLAFGIEVGPDPKGKLAPLEISKSLSKMIAWYNLRNFEQDLFKAQDGSVQRILFKIS